METQNILKEVKIDKNNVDKFIQALEKSKAQQWYDEKTLALELYKKLCSEETNKAIENYSNPRYTCVCDNCRKQFDAYNKRTPICRECFIEEQKQKNIT